MSKDISSSRNSAKKNQGRDAWQMRALRYQRKGFRPGLLLTSLTDSFGGAFKVIHFGEVA